MADRPDSSQDQPLRPKVDDAANGSSQFRVPAPGSIMPRVRPASISSEAAPSGASLARPNPSPLPDRGAPTLLFITLAAALLAVTFTLLIALKL